MQLKNNSWRDYQNQLKKEAQTEHRVETIKRYAPFLPVLIAIGFGIFFTFSSFACRISTLKAGIETIAEKIEPPDENILGKEEVRHLFTDDTFLNLQDKSFNYATSGEIITVDTSIDIPLQTYLISELDKLHQAGRGMPRHLAIVAVEPSTGRVLSMACFDKNNAKINHCLSSEFPAASLFKIVTASAAIEKCGLTPESRLEYNGGKYTLYRSQLKDRKNKYTNRVSLQQSFAQSINPVFGKIGANMLGKEVLEEYAASMMFNKAINFEIPIERSCFKINDTPYEWAELACGFNRRTMISPLHSALLSAFIVNSGILVEPTIVDKISNEEGEILYKNEPHTVQRTISSDTSDALKTLMAGTIKSGTASKAFRGYKRDDVLSKLNIGGKTGSIYNTKRDVKYDWFVGFAEEKNGSKNIAVSVVVGHEKYIGKRASNFARMAMKEYFKNYYLSSKAEKSDDNHRS